MSNPTPVPTREQLVELFNEQLALSGIDTEYTEEDLTFGDPVAYEPGTVDPSEPEAINTRITVTAGEGLEQIVYQLHYTRLDLTTLGALFAPEVEGTGSETSTHDLLEALSAHLRVELTEDDLEDELLEGDGVITVTLRAKADSITVIGETTLTVTASEGGSSE
jgi:hypothetical protein